MAEARFFAVFLLTLSLISVRPFSVVSFSQDHPTDRQILVLLDDLSLKSSHSLFFNALRSRGFSLDFKLANDPSVSVKRYGQYLYDGLILFAPSTDRFGGSLDLEGVLDFVDSGHDLILAADSNASDLIRNIASESGVDFDEDPSAVVIDHTGYAVSKVEGDHTLIASDSYIESDVILGSRKIEAPVLFKGIGHSLNPKNSLVLKVLSASPSAYSANPTSKLLNPPPLTGTTISLVSVLQARNNARVMITGSLAMFSNKLFKSGVQRSGSSDKYENSGNEQFVTELSKWVFHERGHLKAMNLKHNKIGETEEPAGYRINDDLEFSVELFEWSGSSWVPYVANDVQVQFFMMSPYVLKNLSTNKKGLYHTSFKVPDIYGVFQFKVEYKRLGYTTLSLSKQIPVRPFKHNEYERFITTAYPYYGASFATMAGFFIFSFVFLYHK
ncbi:dolichyl-diphosphooligosaccharide--protein glycosyltransferase 48 kDa subunit-like [Andrographis paniculata]|uniref:dolichyl-diphosphooligosaccharide--protein glycosyltransferase 48 kDa subunit-like n=1 Tax=Andrographis paniculata TaxID=175694 RepID=UPI0021E74B27|nr:dolichyl-diphosphooligosaccharide--protein glycosyltransferase 48 kDa subunit-like [Andrographis paniculata]